MTRDPAPDPAPGDEELMRRIQADDIAAFEVLYDRLAAEAFSFARMRCNSTERAEEAVQDAFLSLWRTRSGYDRSRGDLRRWLFALIRNRSIDIHRRNQRGDGLRAPEALLDRIPGEGSVEEAAVRLDTGAELRALLQQLPELQREVIVLAYFEQLSHVEIAQRLRVPLGTIKGRMRLGLSRIRTAID